MEEKEEKPLFFKLLTVFIIILIIQVFFFIYSNKSSFNEKSITGNSIKENIIESYNKLSPFTKILIIVQWAILIILLIIANLQDRVFKNRNLEEREINLSKFKQETDLDSLYEILKEKEQLSIYNVAKFFKVENDIAMEWCKILESGDLVTIEYPMFGGPIVRINKEKIALNEPKKINFEKSKEIKYKKDLKINIKSKIKKQ